MLKLGSKLFKGLLITVASLLVTCVLIELGLRTYYHFRPKAGFNLPAGPTEPYTPELVSSDGSTVITFGGHGDLKLTFHPYLVYKNLPNQNTGVFTTNSLGLRGPEVAVAKPPDVFRIIVTGGSSVFDTGVIKDADTMVHELEENINACKAFSQRVEVLNAGVMGYMSLQELIYLQTDLINLNPDMVIVYDGYNDFVMAAYNSEGCSRPYKNPERINFHPFFREVEQALIKHAQDQTAPFLTRLKDLALWSARKSQLVQLIKERWPSAQKNAFNTTSAIGRALADAPPATVPPEAPPAEGFEMDPECVGLVVDNYKTNIAQMATLLSSQSIPLLVIVQPHQFFKKHPSEQEAYFRETHEGDEEAYPWYRESVLALYPQMIDGAMEVAQNNRADFLDLRNVFDNTFEEAYVDTIHTNALGNKVIAQAIADYLCRHAHGR